MKEARTMMAYRLGLTCVLAAIGAGATGTGALCGCPATCSPVVCVSINHGCPPERVPGEDCAFRFCSIGVRGPYRAIGR